MDTGQRRLRLDWRAGEGHALGAGAGYSGECLLNGRDMLLRPPFSSTVEHLVPSGRREYPDPVGTALQRGCRTAAAGGRGTDIPQQSVPRRAAHRQRRSIFSTTSGPLVDMTSSGVPRMRGHGTGSTEASDCRSFRPRIPSSSAVDSCRTTSPSCLTASESSRDEDPPQHLHRLRNSNPTPGAMDAQSGPIHLVCRVPRRSAADSSRGGRSVEHRRAVDRYPSRGGPACDCTGLRAAKPNTATAYELGYRIQVAAPWFVDLAVYRNTYTKLDSVLSGTPFLEASPEPVHVRTARRLHQ